MVASPSISSPTRPLPASGNRRSPQVVVIGAGIGGLTAAALLAHRGYGVQVFDQAIVPGGCASTFKRRGFTFDVGATQVAGLEQGGIHQQIFAELGLELPEARPCDPACAVFLPNETEPIQVWRDPEQWQAERERHFPGSGPFWRLLKALFDASWAFQGRDPVLPPRSPWDVLQLLKALRSDTLITVPYTFSTVGNALRLFGLGQDQRLRTFLDMQLKLYSQVTAEKTALLYAATALAVSQEPQGLFHLEGSMQVLSDRLTQSLTDHGGELHMRHRVERIHTEPSKGRFRGLSRSRQVRSVTVRNERTDETFEVSADHIVTNVTVQDLVKLMDSPAFEQPMLSGYRDRVEQLPEGSGAFVIYLGVEAAAIPSNCPPHLQFLYDYDGPIAENNSLFVSVSREGDGRAPTGKATIIASSFTDVGQWWQGSAEEYEALKQRYTEEAIARLKGYFDLSPDNIVVCETATPRTFAKYTARDQGIVGGIGQRVPTFGPFGFATRTPLKNLWLVGDSTHPGEGTAGVSYSALTAVRQLERSTKTVKRP